MEIGDICVVARVDFLLPPLSSPQLWLSLLRSLRCGGALLTGSSLMCINDQRKQASLRTKQIIAAAVRRSSKTLLNLCSRPR